MYIIIFYLPIPNPQDILNINFLLIFISNNKIINEKQKNGEIIFVNIYLKIKIKIDEIEASKNDDSLLKKFIK